MAGFGLRGARSGKVPGQAEVRVSRVQPRAGSDSAETIRCLKRLRVREIWVRTCDFRDQSGT